MLINTTQRSDAPELMDDFSMEGDILKDALDKIASINKLLGGNKVTLQGVEKLILNSKKTKTIRILDVGCGNGDMLRCLANWGKQNGWQFELHGIDANAFTIKHAQNLSVNHSNITYNCSDIFEADEKKFDIILCTLTLHHFKDEEILTLMLTFICKAEIGIVINDLERSKLAYYLFKALCMVFRLNFMSREDGLVSILKGFKKKDLQGYAKVLNLSNYSLNWKWAFRYQWIIKL
jgi:2-polyprenyl-3-methyl-5-hydroxy-6-metoxy-1,4-benzoquinol methylase